MKKAIFLDKDGTLVDNHGYPNIIPSDKIYFDKTTTGLKKFQDAGYLLIIISNQSWNSRGRLTKEEVDDIFSSIILQYLKKGVKINGFYYCPHQESDNCNCRKPKTELLEKAIRDFNINIKESFIIGDSEHDIIAGKNIGLKTCLVMTGRGNSYKSNIKPDYKAGDINRISEIIIRNNG